MTEPQLNSTFLPEPDLNGQIPSGSGQVSTLFSEPTQTCTFKYMHEYKYIHLEGPQCFRQLTRMTLVGNVLAIKNPVVSFGTWLQVTKLSLYLAASLEFDTCGCTNTAFSDCFLMSQWFTSFALLQMSAWLLTMLRLPLNTILVISKCNTLHIKQQKDNISHRAQPATVWQPTEL